MLIPAILKKEEILHEFQKLQYTDDLIYGIDWYSSQAYRFGLMSFDKGNPLIGRALFEIMENLINKLKLHRIEWGMVSGNPVERHYDKFCEKYNGRKIVLRDTLKDRLGEYHDSIIYEIIRI